MEEMQEEYEQRLKTLETNESKITLIDSPSKTKKKEAHLLTEIAIFEEKLNAEKLARARAEQEVQHLRACIEERDGEFPFFNSIHSLSVVTVRHSAEMTITVSVHKLFLTYIICLLP